MAAGNFLPRCNVFQWRLFQWQQFKRDATKEHNVSWLILANSSTPSFLAWRYIENQRSSVILTKFFTALFRIFQHCHFQDYVCFTYKVITQIIYKLRSVGYKMPLQFYHLPRLLQSFGCQWRHFGSILILLFFIAVTWPSNTSFEMQMMYCPL